MPGTEGWHSSATPSPAWPTSEETVTSVDAVGLSGAAGSADDTLLKKDFGTIGLLFTAVGSIIGSGWLFGALKASQIAGPAAIFSWVIGTVIFVLIGLTTCSSGGSSRSSP
ncbi:MAG: hypothetical protein ACRDQU_07710 [Pseudonocardiaceae bacterium]